MRGEHNKWNAAKVVLFLSELQTNRLPVKHNFMFKTIDVQHYVYYNVYLVLVIVYSSVFSVDSISCNVCLYTCLSFGSALRLQYCTSFVRFIRCVVYDAKQTCALFCPSDSFDSIRHNVVLPQQQITVTPEGNDQHNDNGAYQPKSLYVVHIPDHGRKLHPKTKIGRTTIIGRTPTILIITCCITSLHKRRQTAFLSFIGSGIRIKLKDGGTTA